MVAENRLRRGMSQQELAILCGTTQSAIARLERGGRPPKLDTLMRIADALDAELLLEMRLRPPRASRISGQWRVTLRDFMSSGDVLTIEPSATLGEAARAMRKRDVGAAVVVEGGAVVGIFTERDLLRAIADSRHPDVAPGAVVHDRRPGHAAAGSLPERGGPDHERAPVPAHPGDGGRRARGDREHPRPHVGRACTSTRPMPTSAPISPEAERSTEYRFGGRAGRIRGRHRESDPPPRPARGTTTQRCVGSVADSRRCRRPDRLLLGVLGRRRPAAPGTPAKACVAGDAASDRPSSQTGPGRAAYVP